MKDYKFKYYIIFVAPALLLFSIYTIIPMVEGFFYSFTDYDGISKPNFIGLENFHKLFTDSEFFLVLIRTFVYVFAFVSILTVCSMAVALLLCNSNLKFKGFFRISIFIPSIISFVVVGVMWRWLLSDSFSVLNQFREAIGLQSIQTLSSPIFAFGAAILVSVWARLGFFTIIYLGGVLNIPSVYKEASSIDGANAIQHFRHVTLPMLKPITLVVVILSTIEAFKAFPLIINLTGGGPNNATTLIVQYIYETGFQAKDVGYASAMSFILLIIVAIFTIINFKMSGEE